MTRQWDVALYLVVRPLPHLCEIVSTSHSVITGRGRTVACTRRDGSRQGAVVDAAELTDLLGHGGGSFGKGRAKGG